jgi:flavorubredoxin
MHAPTKTRFEPTLVAPETFLVHDHMGEGTAPVSIALNTLVIRAAEPVVVDTGMAENREQYLADVFSLVDPEDIRWVFISHDDVDHTGNVNALMDAAPNATLVVNWFMQERMGASLAVSPLRQRWIGDGEAFDVGDRVLRTVRPPIFDSPTTRGLYDPTTGVYWGVDSFATPMPVPVTDAADLPADVWLPGMATFDNYVSPWLQLVDDAKYQATVDRIAALEPKVLVGCHTPVVRGADFVARAIEQTRLAPSATFDPEPDQALLDEIQRALGGAVVAA